jgi:nucleotide-binding universal stress UspA family protein
VRAYGVGAPVNVYAEVIASERQDAATYLESVRQRLQWDAESVRVRVLDGNEAAALLDYVQEAGIDLVIMTTHGREGLVTRWALGSVADRVAHGSAVPVLLVPAEGTGRTGRY